MTLAGNFENFYFQPNFALMIEKVTNFWENWLNNKKLKGKRKTQGVKHPPPPPPPPVLIGLRKCTWILLFELIIPINYQNSDRMTQS